MAERRSSDNAGSSDPRPLPPGAGGPGGPAPAPEAGGILDDLGRAFASLLGRPRDADEAAPGAADAPRGPDDVAALRGRVAELEAELERARAQALGKSELLATMTHELRTPMNGMMGMAHLLLETELDRDQRGMVEVLLHAGEGLLDLVNDTLDFSRVEAGKLELERLPFDLRVTVDEVGALLAPMANEKGLHFECAMGRDVPARLLGDPGRLRQVLLNLGGNAVKFTEQGRVTVAVERLEPSGSTARLRFSITDTGIGMDGRQRARIFEAFEQGDVSIARRFGGSGLGLAIASRLVALMGGRVGVESEPGRGSTFWFEAPFAEQVGAPPADGAPPPDPSLAGVRVLVVEPSAALRRAYTTKLGARGCRVEAVGDAEAALAALHAALEAGEGFRFALVERELPGMSGEDLGATVRADARFDDTLTVLVTAAGHRGDAARARARGFAAYVSKPLEWDLLVRLLAETRHRAETAPAGTTPELVTLHSMAEAERGRLRILLVEDSAVNQLVTQWTLRRLGYGIHLAATAAAALAAWEREPYDLVLLDLHLPDGDGLALAADLRARRRAERRVPIVAMTGSAEAGERERCLAAGLDEFLAKPVDLGQLCNVVERLTRDAAERGAAAADAAAPERPAAPERAAAPERPAAPECAVVSECAAAPEPPPPDDAPLLREIEAAEADILGLARLGEAPEETVVPEAAIETLSSADVVPLAGPAAGAAPSPGPRPALDLERLEQSSMGIPALRDSLLGTFLSEVRPRLEQLGQAVVARDARRVEFEAHGLKGMCLTLGVMVCGEIFAEMERLGREQQLEAVTPLLKRAHLEVVRAERYIATLEREAA